MSNIPVLNRPQEQADTNRVDFSCSPRVDFHSTPRVDFDHFQPHTYSTPVDSEKPGVRFANVKLQATSMSEPRGVRFESCPQNTHNEKQYEHGVFTRSNHHAGCA